MKYAQQQSGFVILFAIIISTMIVLIGAGVFRIALKETILSSTSSESQVALYAADTGLECALFHEYNEDNAVETLRCLDEVINKDFVQFDDPTQGYSFDFDFTNLVTNTEYFAGSPACGKVTTQRNVTKTRTNEFGEVETVTGTNIVSRGYNICFNGDPDVRNSALVERRLEAWFPTSIVGEPEPEAPVL